MRFNFQTHLNAVTRSVTSLQRDGRQAHAVALARSYPTTVEDLWDAVTNGERVSRWFLPISGELELDGRFQLVGNAGGVITACERLCHFALTWEFGGDVSWVEARISEDGSDRARPEQTSPLLARRRCVQPHSIPVNRLRLPDTPPLRASSFRCGECRYP